MNTAESTTRRVLFLDIDGCVSPSKFGGPTVRISGDWNGIHDISAALIRELQQLQSEGVVLILSTSWQEEAQEALEIHLGRLHTLYAVNGDGWWKTRAINEFLAEHLAHITIMIDDEAPEHAGDWPNVTAMVVPEPHLGLTPAHLCQIRTIFFD